MPTDGEAAPRVIMRAPGRAMAGSDWVGLKRSEASELVGIDSTPLFAGFLGLGLLLLVLSGTWWREGR